MILLHLQQPENLKKKDYSVFVAHNLQVTNEKKKLVKILLKSLYFNDNEWLVHSISMVFFENSCNTSAYA